MLLLERSGVLVRMCALELMELQELSMAEPLVMLRLVRLAVSLAAVAQSARVQLSPCTVSGSYSWLPETLWN